MSKTGSWITANICLGCGQLFNNPQSALKLCNQCKRMHLCSVCKKYTNCHIDMVDTCRNCVYAALNFSKRVQSQQTAQMNTPITAFTSTTSPWASSFGYSTPSPINPNDSIFRDKNNKNIDRDKIYKLFQEKSELVLKYDWVAQARNTLAPMIDMVVLAILNEIFEELGYEVIDTKFFKKM